MKNRKILPLKFKLLLTGLLATLAVPVTMAQDYTNLFSSYLVGGSSSTGPLSPYYGQHAVLGRSAANGSDDLILVKDNVTQKVYAYSIADLKGSPLLSIPAPSQTTYTPVPGDPEIDLEQYGPILVLRPLKGADQSALVVLASTRKLYVYTISTKGSAYSIQKLNESALPVNAIQSTNNYVSSGHSKRLALMSTSASGTDVLYHLALSNPTFHLGGNDRVGRVDFITLNGTTGMYTQPNSEGITSMKPSNMYSLNANANFGKDIAPIGDLDGDGVVDLAVLAGDNTVYVFFMESANQPKNVIPKVHTGAWTADLHKIGATVTSYTPYCHGLNTIPSNLSTGAPLLVLGCSIGLPAVGSSPYSDQQRLQLGLQLNSTGDIQQKQILAVSSVAGGGPYTKPTSYNKPLVITNTQRNTYQILNGVYTGTSSTSFLWDSYTLFNMDHNDHFSLNADGNLGDVFDLDSLFYMQSGITSYELKTISGLVDCGSSTSQKLSCKMPIEAAGSWSALQISAVGACDALRPCKLKDTVFIYGSSETAQFPVAIPSGIVISQGQKAVSLGNLYTKSVYYRHLDTTISMAIEPINSKYTVNEWSYGAQGEWLFQPKADMIGQDVVHFALNRDNDELDHTMPIYVVPSNHMITGKIPATPGNDTVYSAFDDMFLELPKASESGELYTYDIPQEFKGIAMLVGDYLRITTADNTLLSLRYTHNGQIKSRDIYINLQAPPTTTLTQKQVRPLQVQNHPQGILIQGLERGQAVRVFTINGQSIYSSKNRMSDSQIIPIQNHGLLFVQVQTDHGLYHAKVLR